jgi:hypothetical protein
MTIGRFRFPTESNWDVSKQRSSDSRTDRKRNNANVKLWAENNSTTPSLCISKELTLHL